MRRLDGKVAIVTGATSGMGSAIAKRFAMEGAAVVVGGRNAERGEDVASQIREAGGKAEFVPSDVATLDGNLKLVEKAVAAFGRLDIVVANAGVLGIGSVTTVPIDTWHHTIATNLNSVFYLTRAGIPQMQKCGGGTIVVNGSIAAYKGFPNHPAYCASKGALVPLVKQIAIDYGPSIRINLLSTGQVDTPLLRNSVKAFSNPESVIAEVAEKMVLKRIGAPEDIASAALFLASDESSWITGASLTIDGGITCG